jgi:TonB-dependent SusC/RagA subfamily outer membrane receptor
MLRLLLGGLCLLWLAAPLRAQQLLARARQTSYLTKVFRLSNEQARFLYQHDLHGARPDFFRQPVDSFPTDSAARYRRRPLPPGYYLVAHTEGPQLRYWLRAETDRLVTVLDNQVDLTLVVRDSLGRLLGAAAQVQLRRRRVPYDAATQTHRLARAGRPGLVAVTYRGRTTYHSLERTFPEPPDYEEEEDVAPWVQRLARVPPVLLRGVRRVAFGFPLGYLVMPVRRLVLDLVHFRHTNTGPVGLARSAFSAEVRQQRQQRRHWQRVGGDRRQQWTSYVAFSKPRYRPSGDTLRLKIRLLHRPDGRPLRRRLVLWLGGADGPAKKLAELRPVRPGSYEYAQPLVDSLGLRPDTRVQVRLATRGGATLASGQFALEDYELGNTRYALRVGEKEHRRGAPQAFFLRGTDANELNLLDARVQLSVTPAGAPGAFAGRQLFVPDTLWRHAGPLDAVGETRLELPDRVLPAADLRYQVQAVFLNADHERHSESASVPYLLDPGQLTAELRGDSVRLRYLHLGQSRLHRARLKVSGGTDLEAGPLFEGPVQLPLALALNPRAYQYELTDSLGHRAAVGLDESNAGLSLRSDRTHDSLFLALDNPRRLFSWRFVYRGRRLVHRSYGGPDWQLALPAPSAEPWYVSVHYLWGDEMLSQEYVVPLPQKQLRITAEQPEVAYPGQRIELRYSVTDGGGRPVAGADLTSYAHTSKFEQPEAPGLPSFEPRVLGRASLRRFELSEADFENNPGSTRPRRLDWARWRPQLGLDSLRFYDFLYPESGQFYEYRPAPGGLTQVAPFVVDSGRVQAPIAVYIDGVPAYVHDVNLYEPYSFVAEPGLHTVAIRTADRLVTLQQVYLRHLHKLTFSVDVNQPCQELTVERRPRFRPEEQLGLARALLLLDPQSVEPGTLLRQGNRLQPLNINGYRTVGGPFRPDSVLLRHGAGGLRRSFVFEPLFRYTLAPGLLTMRCVDPAAFGPLSGSGFPGGLPLDGFAYTEAMLRPQASVAPSPGSGSRGPGASRPAYGLGVDSAPQRAHYYYAPKLDNPTSTAAGQGRLELRLPVPPAPVANVPARYWPEALYLLVTRPDQPKFQRLLAGLPTVHGLPPGRYRVAVLRADSACWAPAELVTVPPDGTTYLQLRPEDRVAPGRLSRRIGRLVRQRVPRGLAATPLGEEKREVKVTQPQVAQPGWLTVSGKITDHSTGEGLPGVTVLVKGTTTGASTNADGTYSLQVPPGATTLVVSSVGYVSAERPIRGSVLNLGLSTDTKQLSEVVVTGYGSTTTRKEITYAVASVSGELQGRVAGVQVGGAAGGVRVRGNAPQPARNEPLVILDGLPFNGRVQDIDPTTIASTTVLRGEQATGLYGSRAAAGVIVITTKAGATAGADGEGADPRRALRRRFSDNGWWRPTLVTDARGQARTSVTLPDDVTGWDTFVLGSDGHGRTGSATAKLRSFKALRAELAVPRFLLAGDQAQVVGKTLNYLPDTARVSTSFQLGAAELRRREQRVAGAALDTLTVTAPATPGDSLLLSFGLAQASGYQDGEQRPIPILPVGTQERVGSYFTLTAADTTLTLPPFDPQLGPVTLRLETDPVPALLSEIRHVQAYAYLCNEQAASKLKALLLERRIREAMGEKFAGDRAVSYLVRKLLAGRYAGTRLWGTWPTSPVSYWASVHVLEALLGAQRAGYAVSLDRAELLGYLGKALDEELARAEAEARLPGPPAAEYGWTVPRADNLLRLLRLLHQLQSPTDYATYLTRLARLQRGRQPLDRYLATTELRQQLQLPYQLDTLRRYRLRTQLGGVYYADTLRPGPYYRYLLDNAVGSTLLAYRLLRQQGGHEAELTRMRVYLLGLRRGGHWRSTYEAAQILETIGPDLFAPGRATLNARVTLGGGQEAPRTLEARQLPFETTLPAAAAPHSLRKEGLQPVYATAYQTYWNPAPAAQTGDFAVTTTLAGQTGRRVTLRAGQPAELLVTVDVKAAARYVLVEVPIPAGCSYGPKAPASPYEVHREYLRHQTGIFLDYLPVGRHQFRISLQPRYRGRYTLNPAKAELVYFPTQFGRTDSKQAVVQ